MKIAMKEWWKDKYACTMLLISFIAGVTYTVINARILILISETIADPDNIQKNLTILIIACIANATLSMIERATNLRATHSCFTTMNNEYANKILDADYEMFTKFSVARIHTLGEFTWKCARVGRQVFAMVENVIMIIVTLASMYIIAGDIIILVIAVYVIGALVAKHLFTVYGKMDEELDAVKRSRNQDIENTINGFAEVRSFNMVEYHRDNIHAQNREIFSKFMKRATIDTTISGVVEIIDTIGLVLIIVYALQQVAEGKIDLATAMSLVLFVFRLVGPLMNILGFADELSADLSLAKEFAQLINYENTTNNDGNIKLDSFEDGIDIKNVKFAYNDSSTILNGLNMIIKKGQKIGICGKTGDGKSTLLKLLNKFYSAGSGEITIDGINIDDISSESYRKKIASVHQENVIFPGTIKENIMYGNINATEYEVIEACKKAKLYDFIKKLDKGFETTVGPRGIKLSGGQRQRIALARLFLMDPDIILLDEATSALDNETETFIQDVINSLSDKTIITVAHRLSTIKNFDCIYVMENGRVIESGTHAELMENRSRYFEMVNIKE